jgi:Secretion system C-terminal sorting domain
MVYPNPFVSELRIDAQFPATAITVRISDVSGRILLSQKHEAASIPGELVLSGLDRLLPGTYVLTVTDAQGQPVCRQQLLKR